MLRKGSDISEMELGPDGEFFTARDSALKVREIRITRAEEHRVLTRPILDPVARGEITVRSASSLWRRVFRY